MSRTTALPKDFTEAELQEIESVSKLMKYVVQSKNVPTSGRFTDEKYCLIFWPDIFSRSALAERLRIFSQAIPLEEDDRQLKAVRTIGKAHHELKEPEALGHTPEENAACQAAAHVLLSDAAKQSRLQKRTEKLLGPLLVEDSTEKSQFLTLFMRNRKRAPFLSRIDPSVLANINHATVFRRTEFNAAAVARTRPWLLPPSKSVLPMLPQVPHILQLLWHACYNAYVPSDPRRQVLGVEFLRSGYIGINWRVFRKSVGWPKIPVSPIQPVPIHFRGVEKLTDKDIMLELEQSPVCKKISRGLIKYSLDRASLEEVPLTYQLRAPDESRYVHCSREISSFELHEDEIDYCTLIDPLILIKNLRLFDGMWYENKLKHKTRLAEMRFRGADEFKRAAIYHSKVMKLMFKPADYLVDKELERFWLPDNHVEEIYAIRRGANLLFSRPNYLTDAKFYRPDEEQAWYQAMDSMHLEDEYLDTGDLSGVCEQSKSKLFQAYSEAYMQPIALRLLGKNFRDLNESQKRRIRKEASIQYGKENTDSVGARIWHDQRKEVSLKSVRLPEAVRTAMVMLPGTQEPTKVQFFTPRAVRRIKDVANGTFKRIAVEDEGISKVLGDNLGPTPYLLAWSRFCESLGERGVFVESPRQERRLAQVREHVPKDLQKVTNVKLVVSEDYEALKTDEKSGAVVPLKRKQPVALRNRWWPEEDFVLMMHYNCPYPRAHCMTKKEWNNLLAIFATRSKATCGQRVSQLNKILIKCVHRPTFHKLRIGSVTNNELACTKNLLLIGFAKYLQRKERRLHVNQKGLQHILKLSEDHLKNIGVPSSYGHEDFFSQFDT